MLEEVGSDAETENFELMKSGEGDIGIYRVKSSGHGLTARHNGGGHASIARPETAIRSRRFSIQRSFHLRTLKDFRLCQPCQTGQRA